ncbi:MAG TPA: S9 family peptidase [Candidatus Acidoferrum sp.]|nr:S9 family peptidase [Candidatus Acidoferrum sp.]
MIAKTAAPQNVSGPGPIRYFAAVALGALVAATIVPLTAMAAHGTASAAAKGAVRTAQTGEKQKGFQIADLAKLVRVSDPQISPDDKSVVVVVSRVNMKEDRSDNELVLIDLASGAERTLTSRKGASSPRWSPSGDRLGFLAEAASGQAVSSGDKEDSSGPQPQIFVLPMTGGEAQQITHGPDGVEQFAWRPDGKAIAYVTPDPTDKKAIKEHHDAFEVGDTDDLETAAAKSSHVWIVLADGGAKRVTSGSWSLPIVFPPSPPSSPLSWSPDGKSLVITKQETPEPGDGDETTIQILDVATGSLHKLTSHEKFESAGEYSPDGSRIAYWYALNGDPNNQNEIFVTSASGSGSSNANDLDATHGIDRNIQRAIWMPDGQSLLVGGHDGTRTSMWVQSLNGSAKKLDLGDIDPSWSFWIDATVGPKGDIAFTGSTPGHPTELYYLSSADAQPRLLTHYNDWISSIQMGEPQSVTWQGPNGFHEDGVLVPPPDFSRGKRYPLVLLIHGGPQASSTVSFSTLSQILAAQGYLVFEPNYRGSDNLGNAYQRAIYRDAGDGPGRDVMAGLAAVEKAGNVDTNKIAVSGWSYGGYMTSWMIGHYHIWKTAVSGAAVNDLTVEATISDGNRTDYYSMGGSPWVGDNWKIYRDESPITYAAQIRTPTLIMCDVGDFRVPIPQSFEMYHALKDNGVTTKFIAYPVAGHFPGDPVRAADVMSRWMNWINQYLK